MVDQIHVPAFFEKLSANGLQPRTKAEARQFLELGAVLAHAEAEGQTKQAEDGSNPFLTHVLAGLQPQPDVDNMIKKSADELVGQSDLAKTAALVYAHAQTGGELTE
jgi:hypothetical protein